MIKNLNEYLTSFQVAEQLGFSADHIRRLICQGKIKATKLGNNWLIKPADLKGIGRQRKVKEADNGSTQ